jgi:hypothetical protein
MEDSVKCYESLLRQGANRLKGYERRLFMAEVTMTLWDGNPRIAERRFGWGRETVAKGLHELQQGVRCVENFSARGRPRLEDKTPQLAQDIRAIVEPHTQAVLDLRPSERYVRTRDPARFQRAVVEQRVVDAHPLQFFVAPRGVHQCVDQLQAIRGQNHLDVAAYGRLDRPRRFPNRGLERLDSRKIVGFGRSALLSRGGGWDMLGLTPRIRFGAPASTFPPLHTLAPP